MKKFFSWACAAALACVSCADNDICKNVVLNNTNDSLSYSVGMFASNHLHYMVYEEMGIDSTTINNFIAGVRASFPVNITPESRAYAYGLSLGAAAMDMLQEAEGMVSEVDKSYELDSRLFLEGLVSAVYGSYKVMKPEEAADFYKQCRYRKESEMFMQRNARRDNVTVLPSGLQYKIDVEGKGAVAAPGDIVSCIYKGAFVDGRMFDSSAGEVVQFPVQGVIPGFAEALTTFAEGTRCTIYIPWELAYGARGNEGIPSYSALVFDLEIVKVEKRK